MGTNFYIMKKLIFGIFFTIASASVISAGSINANISDPTYESCAGDSLATYNFLEAFTGDWQYAFEISEAQLTDCLNLVDGNV